MGDDDVPTVTTALTQRERSAATMDALLRGTLTCLARYGYANMSITTVCAEAGVSRGTVFHHFKSKQDLAAQAMRQFFDARYDRLMAALTGTSQDLSIAERLDLFRRELGRDAEVNIEILNALRTDDELRALVLESDQPRHDEQMEGYLGMFPEAGSPEARRNFVATLNACIRGLCIEEMMGNEEVEAMYQLIRTMALRHLEDAASARRRH